MEMTDKIRKIIAKADSSTHPEEAAIFLEKAHKLMQENGLSLLDLGRLDSDDPVGVDKWFYTSFKTTPYWETLAYALARYFGCRLIVTLKSDKNKLHSIGGRESARITYQLMWPFIMRQVKALAVANYKSGHFAHPKTAYKEIALALAIRISDIVREREAAEQRQASTLMQVNALVPVDMIDAALAEVFPDMTKGKAKKITLTQHAIDEAQKVSLYTQAPAPKSALKIA